MRTSIDIPDPLLQQVRRRLRAEGRTLREAVIEGLRRTVLDQQPTEPFILRDASFSGEVGFTDGFAAEDLTGALHEDAAARLVAQEPPDYRPDDGP